MAVMARESWTDERLDHLSERMDERFDLVDERFKLVDARFDRIDERFDRADAEVKLRFEQVDERLNRIDGDLQEMRIALKDLHDDNRAANRVMTQGFIALSGAMVSGCVLIAGVAAF